MKVNIAICIVLRPKLLDKLENVLKMLRFHFVKGVGDLLVQLAVFFPCSLCNMWLVQYTSLQMVRGNHWQQCAAMY